MHAKRDNLRRRLALDDDPRADRENAVNVVDVAITQADRAGVVGPSDALGIGAAMDADSITQADPELAQRVLGSPGWTTKLPPRSPP